MATVVKHILAQVVCNGHPWRLKRTCPSSTISIIRLRIERISAHITHSQRGDSDSRSSPDPRGVGCGCVAGAGGVGPANFIHLFVTVTNKLPVSYHSTMARFSAYDEMKVEPSKFDLGERKLCPRTEHVCVAEESRATLISHSACGCKKRFKGLRLRQKIKYYACLEVISVVFNLLNAKRFVMGISLVNRITFQQLYINELLGHT
ncbi:hypothetical protein PoB_003580500 [Plakobranchus ocellatus]|uniref:Uncharacterized protein n=1 Tax=Plakobranchus ocellatus TaxID=259542 RepID=A0AAV4AQZ7_9GAST|nr:hypothetical protein PoB_003580500 [Plakobranchus ocellatus]